MDLTTITVAQFKAQFYRDFPYLSAITYDNSETYFCGDEVYYSSQFYQCLADNVTGILPGSDPQKWVRYKDSLQNWVQDQDIQNAFSEAIICFNQGIFTSPYPDLASQNAALTLAFLYMAAHYLVNDLRAAMAGIQSAGGFPVQSRTVGSVSESYVVPEAFRDSPLLSMYAQTAYGMKYLAMVLPNMTGNMQAVRAVTNP